MPSVRSPDAQFEALMKAARGSASQAGRTVSVTEAKRAIEALSSLPPADRAAVVDAFLSSARKADTLSPAARAFLVALTPTERFESAINKALTHGKVKGQITKGEAERALKQLSTLAPTEARALVQALLDGPKAKALSASARVVMAGFAQGPVISEAEAQGLVKKMERKLGQEFEGRSSSKGLAGEVAEMADAARTLPVTDRARRVFEEAFGRKLDGKSGRVAQLVDQIRKDTAASSTAFTYA